MGVHFLSKRQTMAEERPKVGRKRIACDPLIAMVTMERLASFTDMSIGEVNDRLIESHGIITHEDKKILILARKLMSSLRKLTISKRTCLPLHDELQRIKEESRKELQDLIELLEEGSQPVYFQEVGNERYKEEIKKLGQPLTHRAMQRGMLTVLRDIQRYINGWFVPSYLGYDYPRSWFKDIHQIKNELSEVQSDGYTGLDLAYICLQMNLELISPDIVIEEAMKYVKDICEYDSWYEVNRPDKIEKSISKAQRIANEAFKFYKSNYNIRTRHQGEFDTWKFRENVEYIYDIPPLTKGKTNEIIGQLQKDLDIVDKFVEWKDGITLRKIQIKIVDEALREEFSSVMEPFVIPTITPYHATVADYV